MKLIHILMRAIKASGLFFLALVFTPALQAVPANNMLHTIKQPDGTLIQVRKYGDEHGSWVETLSGHTIDKSPDGYWKYVQRYTDKTPVLSNLHVKQVTPDAIADLGTVHPAIIDTIPSFDESQLRPGPMQPSVLYILVDYDDTPATFTDVSSWAEQIFSTDVNQKTIADYYKQASYGAVNILPAKETHEHFHDGVIGWLRIGENHPVNRPITSSSDMTVDSNNIIQEAIIAADLYIDFVSYDHNNDLAIDPSELAIIVVVAGHEAGTTLSALPNVWGHANINKLVETSDVKLIYDTECTPVSSNLTSKPGYTGPTEYCVDVLVDELSIFVIGSAVIGEIHATNHQATLGISVHELGHLIFGLPDLYDTDPGEGEQGLGGFGVMGNGSWGMDSTTDSFDGETPVLPNAWTQFKLQWLTANAWGPIISAGRDNIPFTKPAIGIAHLGSETGAGTWQCLDNEYFLMQYRADVGYDRGLRKFISWQNDSFTPGLLILHVDETQNTNSLNSRRLVEVEEANGFEVGFSSAEYYNQHLWFDGNATLFNDATTPNSNPNGSLGFSALESSGVEIEVFNSSVNFLGDELVHVNINSACDDPKPDFETTLIP